MRYLLVTVLLVGCSTSEKYDLATVDEGCEVKCDLCVNLSVGCMEGVDFSGGDQYRDVVIPTKHGSSKKAITPAIIIEIDKEDKP